MATVAADRSRFTLAPQLYDRFLAAISTMMLFALVAALARGSAGWAWVPPLVWAHLFTIAVALTLTPIMLLRKRGDRIHRVAGWIWVSSLMMTALLSFGVRGLNGESLSPIHILSAATLILTPKIIITARRKQHQKHRRAVRLMITGTLAVAGAFTLLPDRLIGHWLFG